MKKRTKKVWSISGAIFGVGAVATSITLPIVLSIHSRASLDDDHVLYYENGKPGTVPDEHGNPVIATIKNVLEYLKRMGQKDRTQISRFDYYTAFFIYKEEQSQSLYLQKMWFKWNIYDLDKQIKQIEKDKPKDKEKKIRELNDKKAKEQEKLDFLNRVIKNEASLNYNSSSFKSDYPKILLPLENRKNEEQKKYYEAKKNEIDKYPTRREGEIAWELKRRQEYNQAATDDEAIDWMTSKTVSADAFGQFAFKINEEFTFEQKWAKFKEGDVEDFIFPFLQKAYQKKGLPTENVDLNNVSESNLKSKVIFIGSQSKDPNKILLNLDSEDPLTKNIFARIAQQKLLRVSHALIKIKQNENNANGDWSFVKSKDEKDENNSSKNDTLLNLLSFYGDGSDPGRPQVYTGLLPFIFKQGRENETKMFIDNFAEDPSGKKINGSLGVKNILDYINKDMAPGFALGVLSQVLNDESGGEDYLQKLSDNLKTAMGEIWKEGLPKNQQDLKKRVENFSTDQIRTLANVFRDTFDSKGEGLELSYSGGPGVSITFSQFGMHIFKTEKFDDVEKLKIDIENDLQTVADKQKINESKTQWGDLFSSYFKDNQRRQFIKDNFNQDDKLKDYIEEQENKRTEKQQRIVWSEIVKTINSLDSQQKYTNITDALGDLVKKYTENIDKGLTKVDPKLKPDDVQRQLLEYLIPELKNPEDPENSKNPVVDNKKNPQDPKVPAINNKKDQEDPEIDNKKGGKS